MTDANDSGTLYDVALVGMAGRFPGARDVRGLWDNLCRGVESIRPFSDEELLAAGVDPALLRDPAYVKAGAVLDGVDQLDAPFFGLAPREAEVLDPQHRIFLECAWEALEDAGCVPESFPGPIGIFAGCFLSTYLISNLLPSPALVRAVGELAVRHGNEKDYLATRTSYKLGLKGPSLNVQTSCSTSLVAVHLACQSLLNRECDLALAGGISVRIPTIAGYFSERGGVMSADGHCRAFDAAADGTVFGHGAALVVLKRLEDALADGDHVYAVIKGSAVNNDGSDKIGYTAPSLEGQARVIAEALAAAAVDPGSISYVEAHGTGTSLGDPIEIAALAQAWRAAGAEGNGFCALGSVKTNLGHLGTASGVTGLIKAALMLKHRRLVPSLHFERPNPEIDFDASPFFVQTTAADWPAGDGPRRAAVSSFGMGGTNAHAILEEAPPSASDGAAASARRQQLLLLSARSEAALEAAAARLAAALEERPELPLADVAFTLRTGRRAFPWRRMIVAAILEEALAGLRGPAVAALAEPADRPVAFLFPGQGAQYPGMGSGLYQSEPVFRREIDRGAALLRPLLGRDLRDLLFPAPGEEERAGRELARTEITQPALFVVELALARLWESWGVRPRAMIGHSVGEYVAACLAGVFSDEDALRLVAERGRLMQSLPGGAMLAVSLPEEEILPLLGDGLELAAVNGPEACVVSGTEQAVAGLEVRLAGDERVRLHRLETSHAFHSALMDPVLADFAAAVERLERRPPRIPYLSNLTGDWITAEQAVDPAYWAAHLRRTVRFAAGLEKLLEKPGTVFLEVGPGRTLGSRVPGQRGARGGEIAVSSLRHPRDVQEDDRILLAALGRLWLAGVGVDWNGFQGEERRLRVPLPVYPFERRRYWIEPEAGAQPAALPEPERLPFEEWFWLPVWKQVRPPRPFARVPAAEGEGPWLVLDDGAGLGAEIAARLRRSGRAVTTVTAGAGLSRRGVEEWTVDPGRAEDHAAVLRALKEGAGAPRHVLHLWSAGAPHPGGPDEAELGFHGLAAFAQAWGRELSGAAARLTVALGQSQEVTGGDLLHPERALALGACKVIPQEFPHLFCRAVDLPLSGPGAERAAELVLAEALEGEEAERLVAWRGGQRWAQVFEPVRLTTIGAAAGTDAGRLRDQGVYLVTGGFGGIGLALARHLAATRRARLVLLGRSPLESRAEAVRELERAGAEVLPLQVDVSDAAALAAAVASARQRFGAIHGVFHAAGTTGGGLLQFRPREQAEKVLAPKVRGTRALEACLRGEPLDFFLLFSSTTAVTGRFGQADYCAANLFLDAFAQAHRLGRDTFVATVDWATWREVGMAVDAHAALGLGEAAADLREGIGTAEGLAALERILGDDLRQVVVTPRDLRRMIRERNETRTEDLLARAEEAAPRTAHPRPVLSSAYVPPNDETERSLAALWQDVLGVEPVGIHDNFFELGGNSVTGLQIVARIRRDLGAELEVVSLYEAPSVATLARLLRPADAADAEEEGAGRRDRGERRRKRRAQRRAGGFEIDLDVDPGAVDRGTGAPDLEETLG